MPPTRQQQRPAGRQAPQPMIPFTAAAHEHTEPITTDNAGAVGAAQLVRGPFDVPAYGFMRHLFLEVAATGGTIGAGVLNADYPFNLLQNIALLDVNGAPIYGPLNGYQTLWANIIGGYGFRQDPRLAPGYVGTINASFWLRIPVEISRHNGYGSLANQNAAAAYKLSYNIATSAQAFSTAPTTPPSVQVKSWLEAWSQPNTADLTGRPQQREPLGHGTTQFWSAFVKAGLAAGQQTVLLPRVGNLLRNIVIIARDATGARSDGVFPDPVQLSWDARILRNESQKYHVNKFMESLEAPTARDTGVFCFQFDNSRNGRAGDEDPNLWLPTVQSTRLEIDGNSVTAGGLEIITNDIAPVEVRPDERYVETSLTGFHPNVGAPVPMAA